MGIMEYPDEPDQLMEATVPTLKLRERIREYTKSNREQIRANCLDSLRFGIGEIKARIQELENLTHKDVTGLAGRIKRRKNATSEDMYRLSHAFLQDKKNIETFCKIPGAMQVLVKEFTGKNSERQLNSAECLCNISLGEAAVCEKISSMAGSYLVTFIHTSDNQLVRLCLWTIANILASGIKSALTLMQMQLLPQLWKFYTDDEVANDYVDFREDAAVCMQIIALNSEHLLTPNDRQYIFKHFVEKNPTCLGGEYHLQIIFHVLFSQYEIVASFTFFQQQYLTNCCLGNIYNTKEFKTAPQHLRIIYSIRVLSNFLVCHPAFYSTLLQQISTNWQTNLVTLINKLLSFNNLHLTRELMWFIKNLLNLEKSDNLPQNSFVENLIIPKSEPITFLTFGS